MPFVFGSSAAGWLRLVACLGLLLSFPKLALAQVAQAKTLRAPERSTLEDSLAQEALSEMGWVEEPDPHDKVIEEIEIYVFEVFDHRDPIPDFVNVFHARTRKWVVRLDVLQDVGEAYDIERILETERNLRSLRQLSLANVVSAKGSSEDKVRLLIVVKDVWSLRLNSDWAYGSSGLDLLLLNPTEENLGGLRASLGGLFVLQRDRYVLGGNFLYPRMLGLPFEVGISAGTIQNRYSPDVEGAYGSIGFSKPLYNRRTRWGYGSTAEFLVEVTRKYRNGSIDLVSVPREDGTPETVEWKYHTETFDADFWGVRSFGFIHKFNLWFGLELSRRSFRVHDAGGSSQEALDYFSERALPVSDQRISPYITLTADKTKFHRIQNVEALGILEDFRVGYGVSTTVFAGSELFGSTRNLVGTNVSLGYTIPVGNGLIRVGGGNRIVIANEHRHEGFMAASGRFVSPSFGIGRLHLDGYVGYRYQDYLNAAPFRLGGDNRLRGYPASSFVGKNLVSANAELRSTSVDILSAQVGVAAFYDLGAATDEIRTADFYQGTGFGIRILFPQAERTVLRFDWGLPVSGDRKVLPGAFFFTFGQAFSMPDPAGGGSAFN